MHYRQHSSVYYLNHVYFNGGFLKTLPIFQTSIASTCRIVLNGELEKIWKEQLYLIWGTIPTFALGLRSLLG
jgi:hypothetical protein